LGVRENTRWSAPNNPRYLAKTTTSLVNEGLVAPLPSHDRSFLTPASK
jgi:hypothetical protein